MHKANHSRSDVSQYSAEEKKLAITLPDESAMTQLSAQLAPSLHADMVIYLRGDLGAGKTTLVRGLLQALGYTGRVKSPTYTLIEQYEVAGLNLRHFDLYRFRDEEEWESAGFRDEFNEHNVCIVEWPEQAGELLPPADLEIVFSILPQGRSLDLYAHTDTGKKCLAALHD